MKVTALRCITCGSVYGPEELEYTCPRCGPRRGTLEVLYDYEKIKRGFTRESLERDQNRTMWRYLPILPVEDERYIQPLWVGWTPLYRFEGLARKYGVRELYIKDDGVNPTASYKDRASALAVVKAQEKNKKLITCASTGNAASSLAGFAAASSTPLLTIIFVPKAAPEAKLAQLLIYGAKVLAVEGSYDQAYDLCLEAAERYGWYNRSAAINPYLVEGKKTGALEIAEQLNWEVPDLVLVPVGDGSVISGIYKGFHDLLELGFIAGIPKIIGVQAEGASPIKRAFERYDGNEVIIEDQEAKTLADSIAVGKPRDIVKAVKYVSAAKGSFISVSDEEILRAIEELAERTGVFAEPAAAAAYAGFLRLADQGRLSKSDRVVVMITGSGLKDIAAAREAASAKGPYTIGASLEELERALKELGLASQPA
ncbi:TPA: threonine synthase [Candidatus Bipolaricaulota bacterium]|nr:threonine synthase [Candidatus Bipolaricaulota bacterium]